ncbi:MAG: hypothetical protein ACK508_00635 [Lysobacteraceae bacterium]|jgi:hypothetical protein|uniref:hypothetical protein n=1 Tax=Silanimonas sp. TaxID=1929290 RepID=UPI0022C6B600|nr:hypothetical protein [Silanimonas sp.]MCZ8114231.1 hypothetical protein [Silanimonas sp.]
MTSASAALSTLLGQVRSNARLQVGLGVIGIILVWALHDSLSRWAAASAAAAQESGIQLQRMASLTGESGWSERAEAAKSLRSSLEAQMQPVAAAGLAQAHLQSEAQRWLKGAGLESRSRMQISPPVETAVPRVVSVSVSLNLEAAPRAMLELLRQIESSRQLLVVEEMRYAPRSAGALYLRVRGHYVLEPEGGAGDGN